MCDEDTRRRVKFAISVEGNDVVRSRIVSTWTFEHLQELAREIFSPYVSSTEHKLYFTYKDDGDEVRIEDDTDIASWVLLMHNDNVASSGVAPRLQVHFNSHQGNQVCTKKI